MKKVYIAHPLRGADREKNIAEVTKICRKISELFPEVLPVSPIHAFSFLDDCGEEGEKKALELCLELLKRCDEVWLFGDWERSYGCELEWRIARDSGIAATDFSPRVTEYKPGFDNMRVFLDWLLSEVYAEAEPLKPCPFCGGDAVIEEQPLGHGKIYCAGLDCPIHSMVGYGKGGHCKTRAEAIAAWNRRAGNGEL